MTEQEQILKELKKIGDLFIIGTSPRWMGLLQACKYANCGKQTLLKMYEEGKIKAMQHPDKKNNSWIFDRDSIDTYYSSVCDHDNATLKALKILEKV